MNLLPPVKPKVSLAELKDVEPQGYELMMKVLHEMALRVYNTNEECRANGLESIFDDIISLYDKGHIKIIWDEDKNTMILGVFNPLTGVYS